MEPLSGAFFTLAIIALVGALFQGLGTKLFLRLIRWLRIRWLRIRWLRKLIKYTDSSNNVRKDAGKEKFIPRQFGKIDKNSKYLRNGSLILAIVFFTIAILTRVYAPYLDNVAYDPNTHHVTGKVVRAIKPSNYGVIVYIRQSDSTQELYPKPDEYKEVQPVQPDGSFDVQVYSSSDARIAENDKNAQYYYVLLVPANLNYQDLKDKAINKQTHPWDYAISKAKNVVQGVTNNPQ